MGEKRELDGWKMEEYFCVQGTVGILRFRAK